MRGRAAAAYGSVAVVAVVLLLVCLSVLGARKQGPRVVSVPMAEVEEPRVTAEFPPGFGQLAGLVPSGSSYVPMGGALPVPERAPEFRDDAWVRSQEPSSYTIQVMAARDEAAVQRYLAGREDRSRFSYFRFPQQGGNWFVITTGSFPSHELAASVADSTDFGVPELRPFPRRMGAYQEALESAAEAPASAPPL